VKKRKIGAITPFKVIQGHYKVIEGGINRKPDATSH